jgi:hypothetical protein
MGAKKSAQELIDEALAEGGITTDVAQIVEGIVVDPAWAAAKDVEGKEVDLYPGLSLLTTILAEVSTKPTSETKAAQNAIIMDVLSAETVEDVLADSSATPAEDVLDVPLKLNSVQYEKSDYAEGEPYYALLHVTRGDTGRDAVVSCGAQKVIAQALKLAQLSALPCEVVIRKAKKATRSGYFPLSLSKPGA